MNTDDIQWKLPWRAIHFAAEIPGIQKQLKSEITNKHPLWNTKPIAVGRRVDCDDVLAKLSDGTYANVHLVWGSGPGAFPDQHPTYTTYPSLNAFLAEMEQDAENYEE